MHEYVELAGIVLFYIAFPIVKLLQLLLQLLIYLLSPFYYVIQFLLLPVTYLGQFILAVFGYPLRLEVRARIETVYIYVGIAVLLGMLAALAMYAIALLTSSVFNLNVPDADVHEDRRSARSFRQRKRIHEFDSVDTSDVAKFTKGKSFRRERHLFTRTAVDD